MAAPTPVSALVHSSTLVTAGVYLLIRLSPALPHCGSLIVIIGAFGVVTMLLARLSAILEADIKKIVALSTLSQLGVIITAFALASPALVFFHLIAHAFFKALLFIATGNLIHNARDYQDLRRIGALGLMPFTKSLVVITKLSLCGVPFFSAYFSKEAILEGLSRGRMGNLVLHILI